MTPIEFGKFWNNLDPDTRRAMILAARREKAARTPARGNDVPDDAELTSNQGVRVPDFSKVKSSTKSFDVNSGFRKLSTSQIGPYSSNAPKRNAKGGKKSRYSRAELAVLARARCERLQKEGKPAVFADELRGFESGSSKPTLGESFALNELRLQEVHRGIGELEGKLAHHEQYRKKPVGESDSDYARRTSTEARNRVLEAARQGKTLDYAAELARVRG